MLLFPSKSLVVFLLVMATTAILYSHAHAQNSDNEQSEQLQRLRAGVQSPTAAELGKYGDHTVSLATGTHSIQIPLFTIKGATTELPLTLSYHASGVKVADESGWVGMGWTLSGPGAITRSVAGGPDEVGYLDGDGQRVNAESLASQVPSQDFLEDVHNDFNSATNSTGFDTQPDQYFFNAAGRSGRFVMKDGSPYGYTTPHQNLRIEQMPALSGAGQKWAVTDETGTSYIFDNRESTSEETTLNGTLQSNISVYTSAWRLTAVESVAQEKEITVQYTSEQVTREPSPSFRNVYRPTAADTPPETRTRGGYVCDYVQGGTTETQVVQTLVEAYPDEILSDRHHVRFYTSKKDATGFGPGFHDPDDQFHKLDSLAVFDASGQGRRLQSIQFEYEYKSGRMFLSAIHRVGGDAAGVTNGAKTHTFRYSNLNYPNRRSFAVDHWGYYNQATSNNGLLPDGTPGTGKTGNRDPDYTPSGLLTTVEYPTGGKAEFHYGVHTVNEVSQPNTLVRVDTGMVAANASQSSLTEQLALVAEGHVELEFEFVPDGSSGGSTPIGAFSTITVFPPDGIRTTYTSQSGAQGTEVSGTAGDTVQVDLSLGDDAIDEVVVRYGVYEMTNTTVNDSVEVTGPRIEKIKTYDGMGAARVTTYRYVRNVEGHETSSGRKLGLRESYAKDDGCEVTEVHLSSPVRGLGATAGSPVGYREVRVQTYDASGTTGSTHSYYRFLVEGMSQISGTRYTARLDSMKQLNRAGRLLKKKKITYVTDTDMGYGRIWNKAWTGNVMKESAVDAGGAKYTAITSVPSYYDRVIWRAPKSETVTTYGPSGDAVSTKTVRTYVHDLMGAPMYAQLASTTVTTANGLEKTSTRTYAHLRSEYTDMGPTGTHQLSPVYRQTTYDGNGDAVSRTWSVWRMIMGVEHGFWVPDAEWVWSP